MNANEIKQVMDKLTSLWPNSKMNIAMSEAWIDMLGPFQFDACMGAIKEHWGDEANKFGPDPKKVRELIRFHTKEARDPERERTAKRFHAMSPIEQARAQRDWFNSLADKEPDYGKKSNYQKIAMCAANKAARLHRLQATLPQPRIPTVEELQKIYRCRILREESPE